MVWCKLRKGCCSRSSQTPRDEGFVRGRVVFIGRRIVFNRLVNRFCLVVLPAQQRIERSDSCRLVGKNREPAISPNGAMATCVLPIFDGAWVVQAPCPSSTLPDVFAPIRVVVDDCVLRPESTDGQAGRGLLRLNLLRHARIAHRRCRSGCSASKPLMRKSHWRNFVFAHMRT